MAGPVHADGLLSSVASSITIDSHEVAQGPFPSEFPKLSMVGRHVHVHYVDIIEDSE